MNHSKMFGSISQVKRRWVRDGSGTAHAVRQSDGDHHACFCRKFVKGSSFPVAAWGPTLQAKCHECCHRLEHPTVSGDGPPVPAAILKGRGVQAELGRQRKGRKRAGEQ